MSHGEMLLYNKDTRTLWRQQLWSCFSLPPAPSLQSVCVSGGGKQNVSWCVRKHLHQCCFRKISAATDVVTRGGRCTRQIKRWEEKQPLPVESTTAAFTRYSDWCPLCTSAVWAKPGFYPQRPKQQTAVSGNTLIQVHNALCLVLSLFLPITLCDSHHIFSLVVILVF